MNVITKGWAMLAALLAGGLLAVPTPALAASDLKDGTLHIYDQGKLFTDSGTDKAKSTFGNVKFDHGLTLTIDTYQFIPDDKKSGYKEENKAKFFKDWAVALATGDKERGIYVLVCRSPGYVEVIADKTTRERGFSNENEQKVRDLLLTSFKEAAKVAKDGKSDEEQSKIRDVGLQAAVDYVIKDLKDTKVPTNSSSTQAVKKQGSSIMGWVCIGLVVLLAIWLVVGVIRALSGGGGGGGGYGGGGGGGGFMTGLLGGLFGAMAGMWLYNNVFGGHSYGSDAYASDGYSSGGDTGSSPGDGDFSGDAGAGGGFDDGAGGDTGGGGDFGGGDYGGGGDFGGGGGDFGGGDF